MRATWNLDCKALPATNLTMQLFRRLKIFSPSRMNVSPNVARKLWLVMEPCGSFTEFGATDSAPCVEFPTQLEAGELNPQKVPYSHLSTVITMTKKSVGTRAET